MNIGDLINLLGVEIAAFRISLELLFPLAVDGVHFIACVMKPDSHLLVLQRTQLDRTLYDLVVK